ncbi:MAG: hypothetical protein PVF49_00325 [Anaerolineales bacterium]|jgi:hypothetical protein
MEYLQPDNDEVDCLEYSALFKRVEKKSKQRYSTSNRVPQLDAAYHSLGLFRVLLHNIYTIGKIVSHAVPESIAAWYCFSQTAFAINPTKLRYNRPYFHKRGKRYRLGAMEE